MYTYKQAYDKIIEAYFKDEIKPNDTKFCFCGTLNNNDSSWYSEDGFFYKRLELVKMEAALFKAFPETDWEYNRPTFSCEQELITNYEDKLFEGMCAALEVLREIHINRGENIEGQFEFKKRELATQ